MSFRSVCAALRALWRQILLLGMVPFNRINEAIFERLTVRDPARTPSA